MSQKFPGGFVTKSPVAPTTTAASGIWTLDQQEQYQKAGTWPSPPPPPYVEDVFSTYLYTGNSSTQSINNGIDLAGKGGAVWIKSRSAAANHALADSTMNLAAFDCLIPNATNAKAGNGDLNAFNSNGFSLGYYAGSGNTSGVTYASWTFRKQPKFFDVVTLNSSTTTYNHNLGSTPGCIIVKCTDASGANWVVWHRSFSNTTTNYLRLNSTVAVQNFNDAWPSAPTSTQFSVNPSLWANGTTGVAYLFAHDAGGFGATETENVISCGSFTTNSSSVASITLGYEPQWVMTKRTDSTGPWGLYDTMRGWSLTAQNYLLANDSGAEGVINATGFAPNATGFTTSSPFDASATYIYIAIRRGPMKTPTDATKVFNPVLGLTTAPAFVSSNFNSGIDSAINFYKPGYSGYARWSSRLAGPAVIPTSSASAESTASFNTFDYMNGYYNITGLGTDFGAWMFKRAPGFHDVVCYTGASGVQTVTHNLGVAPELIIIKSRSLAGTTPGWPVYTASGGATKYLSLNTTDAQTTFAPFWGGTAPTSTNFYLGGYAATNNTGDTYVAYLFATCAGVSKVGSYTGDSTSDVVVNCGFTAGARFVLIKRTDAAGDWYVYDSARGINPSNDPYLLLNSTAAEVTGTNYIGPYSTGFYVNTGSPLNAATGATYIYLAIA